MGASCKKCLQRAKVVRKEKLCPSVECVVVNTPVEGGMDFAVRDASKGGMLRPQEKHVQSKSAEIYCFSLCPFGARFGCFGNFVSH